MYFFYWTCKFINYNLQTKTQHEPETQIWVFYVTKLTTNFDFNYNNFDGPIGISIGILVEIAPMNK